MKILKIILSSSLVLLLLIIAGCGVNNEVKEEKKTSEQYDLTATSDAVEHKYVCIEVENFGKLTFELYPEYAPESTQHFVDLVEKGFYDGFTINKIVPGVKMETSEKSSSSDASCNVSVNGEFTANGVSNQLKLERGVIAFNHLPGENNSATSQLILFLGSDHTLDGHYAGFAKITEGTEILDQIEVSRIDKDYNINSPIVMKKVYIKE